MTEVNNRRYKKISKQEFENLLLSISPFIEFPNDFYRFDWKEIDGEWQEINETIKEYGYFIGINDNVSLKIYSSIEKEDDMGRGIGKDAMRIVVVNMINARPIRPAFKKVYRDGNWKEHFRERVSEALKSLGVDIVCPNCGNILFLKRNSKSNERFLGCSAYPGCCYTRTFKL